MAQYLIWNFSGPVWLGDLVECEERLHWPHYYAVPNRVIRYRTAPGAVKLTCRSADIVRGLMAQAHQVLGVPVRTSPDTMDGYVCGPSGVMDFRAHAIGEAEVVRILEAEAQPDEPPSLPEPEWVACDCGHECERVLVLSASLGTSCPDCYDRMSG